VSSPVKQEKQGGAAAGPAQQLDRTSRVPLYHQLFMILRREIVDGNLKHGDFLPTESELGELYQVSRVTVRKAVDRLVYHNLVSRRQGRGTVVLRPTVLDDFGKLFEAPREVPVPSAGAGETSVRVLGMNFVPASDLTAQRLGVEVGEELGILTYLRIANGKPQCVEDIVFVHRLCPDVLVKYDVSSGSFYRILEQEYGVRLVHAVHTVSVAFPTAPSLVKWLQLEPQQPVLYVERVSYTQQGVPFEHVRTHYRSDLYALLFESTRAGSKGDSDFVTLVEQPQGAPRAAEKES